MSGPLTAENVENIFRDCLYNEGEDTEGYVAAQGIMLNVGFHPGRLAEHTEEITAMLAELPDQFKVGSGGGWSFLNACEDRHGEQWTGLHRTVEQLFLLGMAIKKVVCLLPREYWKELPGSVPYYAVDI